jgi:dihydrofolate synthase/folylpolyglutamate synthase
MNYNEAISFLFSSLPMYQRVGRAAYKSDLKNTLALDEHFGHPHLAFRSIHVAGTNGKGSVAHMLAAVLQEAGYQTGLYTSPHLKDFRERIRINGEMIQEDRVTAFVNEHHGIIRQIEPSFFEMTVSMAFDHFARQKVDLAVVEVGMGGRLDSTNVLHPLLSVITNIGMDHSQFLGDTLYKIAREKAGIMKPGVPAVIGQKQQEISVVFERRAREMGCSLYFADQEYRVETDPQSPEGKQLMQVYRHDEPWPGSLELDLLGHYQQMNLATVLKAIDVLGELGISLSGEQVRRGLANVRVLTGLRGRWEILGHNPMIVCDTAHNPEGMKEVLRQIRNMPWKNLHFILGIVNDKDPRRLLSLLPRKARYYFTQASIPRAMDREKLAREAMGFGLHGQVCPSPTRALEIARSEATADDLIFAGGSIFLVAELL